MNTRTGYTFRLGQKEVFVETAAKRKTKLLASKILRKLLLPDNPSQRADLLYYLQKADLEERETSKEAVYYKITGDRFSSTCFEDDIVIINL